MKTNNNFIIYNNIHKINTKYNNKYKNSRVKKLFIYIPVMPVFNTTFTGRVLLRKLQNIFL